MNKHITTLESPYGGEVKIISDLDTSVAKIYHTFEGGEHVHLVAEYEFGGAGCYNVKCADVRELINLVQALAYEAGENKHIEKLLV
jgi:hypothetical protein